MLESGESVPAEIQVKIEEFNDLLSETENHIRDIKEQESRSGLSKPQNATNGAIRLLQEIIIDYAGEIDTKQREFAATMEVTYPHTGPLFTFAIEKGRMALANPKEDPVKDTVLVSRKDVRVFKLHGIDGSFHKPRFREITAALLKFAYYQREAEKDEGYGGVLLIRDKLFPLTVQILGYIADSYGFWVEFQGDIQEYPVCSKVQFIEGQLCADEDLSPALSVKVEEANFLKNKLQLEVDVKASWGLAEMQAIYQKRNANSAFRPELGELAVAKPKREDVDLDAMSYEKGVLNRVINQSAGIKSATRELIGDSTARRTRQARNLQTSEAPSEIPKPLLELNSRNERTKTRKAKTTGNLLSAAERRKAVQAYIDEVLEKTGKRITRTDIWKSAHYKTRTEFERWQRKDPKATKAANERFTRLLKEKPHLE